MEKKLSDLFMDKKTVSEIGNGKYNHSMDIKDVKIYGEIMELEAAWKYTSSWHKADEYAKKIDLIAQEHGITDYKL